METKDEELQRKLLFILNVWFAIHLYHAHESNVQMGHGAFEYCYVIRTFTAC